MINIQVTRMLEIMVRKLFGCLLIGEINTKTQFSIIICLNISLSNISFSIGDAKLEKGVGIGCTQSNY